MLIDQGNPGVLAEATVAPKENPTDLESIDSMIGGLPPSKTRNDFRSISNSTCREARS